MIIVKRLNEVIDNYNNFIDRGLQNELRTILNGWLTDGTMSELVQETAYQDLLKKLNNRTSVSVKDFGAIGDGVTDDTNAIQQAIDEASLGCKTVFVPVGTYKITRSLDLKVFQKFKDVEKSVLEFQTLLTPIIVSMRLPHLLTKIVPMKLVG